MEPILAHSHRLHHGRPSTSSTVALDAPRPIEGYFYLVLTYSRRARLHEWEDATGTYLLPILPLVLGGVDNLEQLRLS